MRRKMRSLKKYLKCLTIMGGMGDYGPNIMAKEETLQLEGEVIDLLPNMKFKVRLENGLEVFAHLCGKMRMRNIRVLVGDRVRLDLSPYDLSKARITYRLRETR